MRPLFRLITPVALAGLLAGCVAAIPAVEVTRFHLGQILSPASFDVEAGAGASPQSLEFGAYKAAITRELVQLGYRDGAENPTYRVGIRFERTRRDVAASAPVTIGVGGSSYGGNVGISLGTSFGVGKRRQTLVATRLFVQIKRASDSAVLWEGRAATEAPEAAPAAQPGLAAEKLSRALFQGFPGESGRTIIVK